MIGLIQTCDGQWLELPRLTEWEMEHSDGTGADCFTVAFWYSASWEPVLKKAVRFRGVAGTETRFFGIVDEYQVTVNREGLMARIYGRGMGGLLLDNQVGQREYYYARLSDMIRNYVTPYGVGAPRYSRNFYMPIYGVDYGKSAWEAFSGFCLWAEDIQPRFLEDGTLVVSREHGERKTLNSAVPVLEGVRTHCRYGVYSAVAAKYIATGYEQWFEDRDFQREGGHAVHRMTVPRRNRYRAGLRSAPQTLGDSAKEKSGLTVSLSTGFWARPMDEIRVDRKELGLQGLFLVKEVRNSFDASGTRCRLTMFEI